MSRAKFVLLLAVLLLVVSGCGKPGGIRGISEKDVKLRDGRTVVCLQKDSGYRGGLSCDWEHAR